MKGGTVSDKTIFVLPSYIGLPLILKYFDPDRIDPIILTNNSSMYQWCVSVGLNAIMTPALETDLSRRAIKQVRQGNEAIAVKFQNCRIYYFFYLSNLPMLHLLRKLGKRNELLFHNADLEGPSFVVTGQLMSDDPLRQMEELSLMYGVTIHKKGNTVYALTAPQLSRLPSEPFRYQLKYLRPKDIDQIKLIRPTTEEIEKGVPEVKELWRDTFGV